MLTKAALLDIPIQHTDVTQHNVVILVDAMASMAFSARDLTRAADIGNRRRQFS
jgi:deoxyhypusine synthase